MRLMVISSGTTRIVDASGKVKHIVALENGDGFPGLASFGCLVI